MKQSIFKTESIAYPGKVRLMPIELSLMCPPLIHIYASFHLSSDLTLNRENKRE